MNFNDEHNTKSTILSDMTSVNDTCILQILQIIVIMIFVIMN